MAGLYGIMQFASKHPNVDDARFSAGEDFDADAFSAAQEKHIADLIELVVAAIVNTGASTKTKTRKKPSSKGCAGLVTAFNKDVREIDIPYETIGDALRDLTPDKITASNKKYFDVPGRHYDNYPAFVAHCRQHVEGSSTWGTASVFNKCGKPFVDEGAGYGSGSGSAAEVTKPRKRGKARRARVAKTTSSSDTDSDTVSD